MNLMNFQLGAIKSLQELVENGEKNIILKSPTGSGKTIILTHFMDEYLKGHSNIVFVWLTPGKGNLEEQSKAKMDKYIHNSQTKLLEDVMTSGFDENDCCFINWERLTKKDNNALKESEKTNFIEHVGHALEKGIEFKVIIDESHSNFTEKADAVVQLFHTNCIIRCSATPKVDNKAKLVEIKEENVIAEGLIKKLVAINENFPQNIETEDLTCYLLEKALEKRQEIKSLYLSKNVDVNPLIIVQLPNRSETLRSKIEEYFSSKNITYENDLALWLSDEHKNLEKIEENNSNQIAVIIKQAVATGWDCPRAHILVKLRENMDETFEIQTIGRIRRMPEAKHYENDVLDTCYLYTFDKKFTEGVKASLGDYAKNTKTLFLKNEYKSFCLMKEQRKMVLVRDSREALKSINAYFRQKNGLTSDKNKNKAKLEASGYKFSNQIIQTALSGSFRTVEELHNGNNLNEISVKQELNTHMHGRDFHNRVWRIGLEIGLEYEKVNAILMRLFGKFDYGDKILELQTKQMYAFVINNFDRLRIDARDSLSATLPQRNMNFTDIKEEKFTIPQSVQFTFDSSNRIQTESRKNVYQGYLMSASPRSSSERLFEKFCEGNSSVDWFYKNGDKGEEFLSIAYSDNAAGQKLFYPDYIVSIKGRVWIIETKGGFSTSHESEDIDAFSPKKFEMLKKYLQKHNLKGGFVRYDKDSQELFICTDEYNDDIQSENWQLLSEAIRL